MLQEQRAESREQRAESREQRAKAKTEKGDRFLPFSKEMGEREKNGRVRWRERDEKVDTNPIVSG